MLTTTWILRFSERFQQRRKETTFSIVWHEQRRHSLRVLPRGGPQKGRTDAWPTSVWHQTSTNTCWRHHGHSNLIITNCKRHSFSRSRRLQHQNDRNGQLFNLHPVKIQVPPPLLRNTSSPKYHESKTIDVKYFKNTRKAKFCIISLIQTKFKRRSSERAESLDTETDRILPSAGRRSYRALISGN